MNKDIKQLIVKLEKQGLELRRSGTTHWKVYRDGRLLTTLPSTPSDRRSLLNKRAELKRQGVVL